MFPTLSSKFKYKVKLFLMYLFFKMLFLDLIKKKKIFIEYLQYSIKMAQIIVQLSFIIPIHRRKEMSHILCEEIKNWGFCSFSTSRRVICLLWPDKCSTVMQIFPFTTEFIFIVLKKHWGWTSSIRELRPGFTRLVGPASMLSWDVSWFSFHI